MLRIISALFLILLLITGCSQKNGFRIEGKLQDHAGDYIKIKRMDVNISVLIDSVKIKNNGSFKIKVKTPEPEFYEIGFSQADFITLLAEPGEKITLGFKGKNLFESYTVAGSPGTSKLMMLDSALASTRMKIENLRTRYNSALNDPDFKEKETAINKEFIQLLKDQRMYNIGFILKNLRSFASVKALYQMIDQNTYVLYDSRDLQYLKIVSDTLTYLYPASKQSKSLKINFDQEYKQSQMNRVTELMNSMPATKLDPSLKDMNGRRIALSSIHGKYVLLAFWSASSEDCLSENLALKELYKKYKNKGFEVYQINLDTNEDIWRKAVRYDELPWLNVREDDPTNPKNAILYNVKVLPANYLYDKEGNIIGANLHGKTLEMRLSQLFDK
jgi:thiol-disulfide isomerase/thioredoxin